MRPITDLFGMGRYWIHVLIGADLNQIIQKKRYLEWELIVRLFEQNGSENRRDEHPILISVLAREVSKLPPRATYAGNQTHSEQKTQQ